MAIIGVPGNYAKDEHTKKLAELMRKILVIPGAEIPSLGDIIYVILEKEDIGYFNNKMSFESRISGIFTHESSISLHFTAQDNYFNKCMIAIHDDNDRCIFHLISPWKNEMDTAAAKIEVYSPKGELKFAFTDMSMRIAGEEMA